MNRSDSNYRDMLKVEFRDMIAKFTEDRNSYHMYSVDRAATMGTLVGFTYGYFIVENKPEIIGKYIDVKSYGKLEFHIDSTTQYATIVTPCYESLINDFLENYPTYSGVKTHSRKPLAN